MLKNNVWCFLNRGLNPIVPIVPIVGQGPEIERMKDEIVFMHTVAYQIMRGAISSSTIGCIADEEIQHAALTGKYD